MSPDRPSPAHDILLTGATGLLGHYLLADLLRRPDVRCRVLLRPPLAESTRRLSRLLGDLGLDLPTLVRRRRVITVEGGLPDRLPAEGLEGLTCILHAAGCTRFHADADGEPARTNVEGTRALLGLADALGVHRFVFVSSAYVCGQRTGSIPERLEPDPPAFRNAYERSKWQAEQHVARWCRDGRSAALCRPSILFGDRPAGRATTFKGLYLIARATELLSRALDDDPHVDRHAVPLRLHGTARATANVVPVDWAAARIARIALDPSPGHCVRHLTNPRPPTHAQVKAWLEEYFDLAGGTFCDDPWPPDDPNPYESLFYSLGHIVHDYFRHGLSFESAFSDARPLVGRAHFLACLRYAAGTNWGRGRATASSGAPIGATVSSSATHPPGSSLPRPPGPIDPRWYFEQFLPFAIPRSRVSRVEALTAVVRFAVRGPRDCDYVCRFDRGRLAEVRPRPDAPEEDFAYHLPYDDFQSVVTGRRPVQEVFFHGGAEMLGNIEKALKMVAIIGAFLSEFPVS